MKKALMSCLLALSVTGTAMADTAPDTKPVAAKTVKAPKAAKASKAKKAKVTTDAKTADKPKTEKTMKK